MSENQVAVKEQKEITDQVLVRVSKLQETGDLILPKNYVAGNALKSAALILAETVDSKGALALEVCSKESISNALFDMVKMGLEPSKKQCYFVAYGKKLQLMISYFGKQAIAKRVSNLKEIKAFVLYEGDEYETEFDLDTYTKKLKSYNPSINNVDFSKIKGAFAIPIFEDHVGDLVEMTFAQVKASWNMGYAKGAGNVHKNFTDEMVKKTIITRVCKNIINSSDDGDLVDVYAGAEEEPTPQRAVIENANSNEIIIDAEVVEDNKSAAAPQKEVPTMNGQQKLTPNPDF